MDAVILKPIRKTQLLPLVLCSLTALSFLQAPRTLAGEEALAVIVNAKNTVLNLTSQELNSYFSLAKQFWPNGR